METSQKIEAFVGFEYHHLSTVHCNPWSAVVTSDRCFGITYVDYGTQHRLPKASFHWYEACIAHHQVV